MDVLLRYPDLFADFVRLCDTRCNEILQEMTVSDAHYAQLCRERSDASMRLRDALADNYDLLEFYSDCVYAQETYELSALYKAGFLDAINLLSERGLL